MDNQNNNLNNQFGMNNNINEFPNQPQPMNNTMNQGMIEPQSMNNSINPGMVEPQPMNNAMNQGIVEPQPMNNGMNQGIMQPPNTVGMNINNTPTNKKLIFIIGGIVLAIAILVVCYLLFFGKKTLTCTKTEDTMGMTATAEIKIEFKKDKAKKANAIMSIDLGEYSSYKDTFVSQFESQFESYEEEGIDVNVDTEGDKVIVKMSATDDSIKTVSESDSNTYSEVKSDLEEDGYTCK